MKLQTKKQLLRGVLLCVGIIIIALSLFYLYNYLDNKQNKYNNEGFTNVGDIYKTYNTGDPLGTPTTILTEFKLPAFPTPLSSPNIYSIDGLQNITSNSKFMYALDASANISYFDNSTNTWKSSTVVANLQSPRANFINKINPSITNPSYNISAIQCNGQSSPLLYSTDLTLWYYDISKFSNEYVDCLYYMKLNTDGKIPSTGASFNCLELPTLDTNNILPTTAGSTTPSMNFDKLNFIAANNNILFALGCNINKNTNTNNLYYCILDSSGSPASNNPSIWQTITVSLANYTIKKIYINNNCLFIYYIYTNSTTTNKTNTFLIKYSPITIATNGSLTLNMQTFCDTSDINSPLVNISSFNTISVNNDVIWAYDSYGSKLWWCALQTGLPPSSSSSIKWNSYSCTDSNGNRLITGISYMVLYNNKLIIFTNSNNFIIPLYNSGSSSVASTTLANPTGTGTTVSNPTGTGTTVANPTGTGTTVSNPTGTGTTVANPTGTGTTVANPTGTGTTVANPTRTGTTTTSPTGTMTTVANTTYPNTTKHYDPVNELLSGFDLNSFFGNGSSSSSSSNLYISPMNNSDLYNPSNANKIARINSSFFPIVKIS